MPKLTNEKKYILLVDTLHKVRDTLDLDEILDHLLDSVKTVVNYDAAGIFVLNPDFPQAKFKTPKPMIAGMIQRGYDIMPIEDDAMLMRGQGIVGHVILSGKSVIVPDVHRDGRYVKGRSRTQSEIAVPLTRSGRTIGALNLESNNLSAYNHDDLEILEFFADAAAISIEKAMLHRQLLERELIDKQLQLAREVQSGLFPAEPPRIPGYDIAGICIPAEEIGGDYYDFIKLPQGGLGIIVADVSGHGIPSALMMTAFRGMLRMHVQSRNGVDKMASEINRQLPEITGDSHFITAVYAMFDLKKGEFTYVCCGHRPCLLLHSDGSCNRLDARGPVLGVFPESNFPAEKIAMNAGDTLLMYTDGVVERMGRDGVEFGLERLSELAVKDQNKQAETLVHSIVRTVQQYSGSEKFEDDFTLVVVKKT